MSPRENARRPTQAWRRWAYRFADAFDGLRLAVRDQESLWVHIVAVPLVLSVATWLQVEAWRWCLLMLCVGMVISLELANSAIERLVKTLHPEEDAGIAAALHMSAAAVLVAAIAAAVVGVIVFVSPALEYWRSLSLP